MITVHKNNEKMEKTCPLLSGTFPTWLSSNVKVRIIDWMCTWYIKQYKWSQSNNSIKYTTKVRLWMVCGQPNHVFAFDWNHDQLSTDLACCGRQWLLEPPDSWTFGSQRSWNSGRSPTPPHAAAAPGRHGPETVTEPSEQAGEGKAAERHRQAGVKV